jgi:hypothetical protein
LTSHREAAVRKRASGFTWRAGLPRAWEERTQLKANRRKLWKNLNIKTVRSGITVIIVDDNSPPGNPWNRDQGIDDYIIINVLENTGCIVDGYTNLHTSIQQVGFHGSQVQSVKLFDELDRLLPVVHGFLNHHQLAMVSLFRVVCERFLVRILLVIHSLEWSRSTSSRLYPTTGQCREVAGDVPLVLGTTQCRDAAGMIVSDPKGCLYEMEVGSRLPLEAVAEST